MKVVDKYKKCKFGEVEQGECFVYNETVYMKVFYVNSSCYGAINMHTGESARIGEYAEVNPVVSNMRWSYESGVQS